MECIIHRVAPEFNSEWAFQYRLSILLRHDGFSYIITHQQSRRILCLSDYFIGAKSNWQYDLSQYIEYLTQIEMLHYNFATIDIAIQSLKVQILPLQYQNTQIEALAFQLIHRKLNNEVMLSNNLDPHQMASSALVPEVLLDYCNNTWRNGHIISTSTIFIKALLQGYSNFNGRHIFVHIWNGYIEVIVIQNFKLLYFNIFEYKKSEDILYYVLFVLEQMGFTAAEEDVMLMGNVDSNRELLSLMKLYCGNVSVIWSDILPDNSILISDIAVHNYYTLLHIPLCV